MIPLYLCPSMDSNPLSCKSNHQANTQFYFFTFSYWLTQIVLLPSHLFINMNALLKSLFIIKFWMIPPLYGVSFTSMRAMINSHGLAKQDRLKSLSSHHLPPLNDCQPLKHYCNIVCRYFHSYCSYKLAFNTPPLLHKTFHPLLSLFCPSH